MSDATNPMRYRELLDEALARIPALAPEWTDHNPSDPGIALLELAAWLTETVLYRSTRIDDRSRRALLGLIEGTDPRAGLTGAALDAAIRDAIKALRRPYRAVVPRDFVDRIRDDWPGTAEAKALGLESRVAHVEVLPRRDLEAADRFARRDAHISVIAVPDRLCWLYRGALAVDRPTLFVQQSTPDAIEATFPAGGPVLITREVDGGVIYEGDFAPGEAGHLALTDADLGTSGELRIDLDRANTAAGMSATGGGLDARRLTAADGPLLGCRFVPIRRQCGLEVVVTSASDVRLKLELRFWSGQVAASAEGVGVVALSRGECSASAITAPRRDWQLRLFAPDAAPGDTVEVAWYVQRVERPWRWNEERGDPLLDGLWRFLDARRLIGTRHHVVGVRWVMISVTADIYLTDGTDPDLLRPRLVEALVAHFVPPGQGGEARRAIGKALHYTEVIAVIEAVPGVDYVEDLSLTPEDRRQADEGEVFGIALDPDEVPVLQVPACTLNLFERS